jgi:hypothetical protein
LTEHLAFLQPYLKGGDTSVNFHVEDTAAEEFNTNKNDGSETLVEREKSDKASSVQLIEKPALKSLSQTHKTKGENPSRRRFYRFYSRRNKRTFKILTMCLL